MPTDPETSSTRPTGLWLTAAGSLVVIALWLGDLALDERAKGACLWDFGALMWLTAVALVAFAAAFYVFAALFWDLPLFRTAGQKKEEEAARAIQRANELLELLTLAGVPEPPAGALQRVDRLIEESGPLHERVLRAKKSAKRGAFLLSVVPAELAEAVREWNQGVLDLADACLPLAEASDVAAYQTRSQGIVGFVAPDQLATVVESNIATLLRIREFVRQER